VNILLSTDTVGGVWDYTATLARQLSGRGHAVLLAVLGDPGPDHLAALPVGVEVQWRPLRLEWMPDVADDVAAGGEWLGALARRWRPDVVHLNQLAYSALPFPAPILVVVHSDVLSWFSETQGREAPPEWAEYAGWVRRGLRAADVVVAPSAYQSALTLRHYGRAADRVIHNGVDAASAPAGERTGPLAISAGRAWDDAKGMATLDHALELLGGSAPEAHLFGELDGPHGQRFRPVRLAAHGRTPREQVDAWMRRATVYVGASRYEPFGLAPLEAALQGCALLLSDIGSFRELWDGCADFFPPGDAAALADAIARLGADRRRREELARAARGRALERYTAERFVEQYLDLYAAMHRDGLRLPPLTTTADPSVVPPSG
jgi:glycogen(starch) synthase